MSFWNWISAVSSSFPLGCLSLLTFGVIFVNGWTDAPNAIASCVATRALPPRVAVGMAACCNFIGLVVSLSLNRTVTDTVLGMLDFGADSARAQVALCAALLAVVLWAAAAWYFGIPTSESHALIAGLTGAALAVGGVGGIRFSVWSRVLWGLALSVAGGFLLGGATVRVVLRICGRIRRRRAERFFDRAQIVGAAANAFLHGAQDGQKFIGVLLLSAASGGFVTDTVPVWMMFLCSAVLSLGTSLGGMRIIRAVGMKMVRLEGYQGFSADLSAALCLWFCTVNGLPVSTTHVKTTAVMGIGAARRLRSVHWEVAGGMVLAWCLTFPGCGLLGFLAAKLFLGDLI